MIPMPPAQTPSRVYPPWLLFKALRCPFHNVLLHECHDNGILFITQIAAERVIQVTDRYAMPAVGETKPVFLTSGSVLTPFTTDRGKACQRLNSLECCFAIAVLTGQMPRTDKILNLRTDLLTPGV